MNKQQRQTATRSGCFSAPVDSRARAGLDGKSLRAVLELPDNDRTLVNQALSLVSERAGEGMGVEEHRAWLMECLARSRQRTPDSPPAS